MLAAAATAAAAASGCSDADNAGSPSRSATPTSTSPSYEGAVWRETERRFIPDGPPELSVEGVMVEPFYRNWPGESGEVPESLSWEEVDTSGDIPTITAEGHSVPIRVVHMTYPTVGADGIPAPEKAQERRCSEVRSAADLELRAGECAFAPTGNGSTAIALGPTDPCAEYHVVQVSWIEASVSVEPIPEASASYGWRNTDSCPEGASDAG
ncbi:hypothetical protein GCM10022402_43360 [Salinactinospora qingdaonensis]|uniref:Secreted protein n=1 Tax=Salinactinospora qingdaonensis TaxID=702744 RepID=A0ABP7GC41_9ACTN